MWARVFVAIDDQLGIVGFYSWSSFTLAVADLAPEQAKRLPRYDVIPAALIGHLARDERVRGEPPRRMPGFVSLPSASVEAREHLIL
jgi:hypothetical protein